MTSQTITIPAREVRPGDVLFGMTVETSKQSSTNLDLWFIGTEAKNVWLEPRAPFTVERPVPSDPIGTVRAQFEGGLPKRRRIYRKMTAERWEREFDGSTWAESDVADFPILWKPGMPISNTEVTA